MEISAAEIAAAQYDPMRIIKTTLNALESEAGMIITNPTNPFTMVLEMAATTASGNAIETRNNLRKAFPSLAQTMEEVYAHIADDEKANMFAVPATTVLAFQISTLDLRQSGYRPDGAKYVEIIIAANTAIVVMKQTPLTLLNDIVIRLYDNNDIVIEQQPNDNDMAINNISLLSSTIYNDEEGVSWILFVTDIKQLKVTTKTPAVTADEGLDLTIDITDKYCYVEVSYANSDTNNTYVRLPISHTEEYIDPSVPTAYVSIGTSTVRVKIPDVYTATGKISGTVRVSIYETKGNLYLPIDRYQDSDFVITLGDTNSGLAAAAAKNIPILAKGSKPIEGGSNGMSLAELKNSVIFNTTGDIDIPVTDLQIERLGSMDGYYVFKATDIITDRTYIASRNLPAFDSNLVKCKQDVFFNTIKLILSEVRDYDTINVNEDNFVIKSNTLFKVDNGIVSMVPNEEKKFITNLTDIEKINFLKENKLYYTPFYYIISTVDGYTDTRIYSLDYPEFTGFRILSQNTTMPQNVNTSKYLIEKTSTGYRLSFVLRTDANFELLDKNYVKMQLAIPLKGDEVNVYFDSTYDYNSGRHIFEIDSDLFIDSEGYIDVKNGMSTLLTKKINIETVGTLYVYSTDGNIIDETKYLVDDIYRANGSRAHTVFSKESINIELGKQVKNIWNRVYNTYSGRKYKTYTFDYPAKYEEDVYKVFDNGSTYKEAVVEGETVLVRELLYKAGDLVVDETGSTVYKHRKGDVIYDVDGNPIIDIYGGIIRYIDIMMFEYEFIVANTTSHELYRQLCKDVIYKYLFTDMVKYNAVLLEKTLLVYKSLKSCLNVTISNNSLTYAVPYLVKPSIILYMSTSTVPTSADIDKYKDTIGKIIDSYLDKSVIHLTEIKAEIMATIGSAVLSVKISGLDTTNSEVITIPKSSNKLVMSKVLQLNTTNQLEVKYNLNVDVQNI